jgi:hypothetical protein
MTELAIEQAQSSPASESQQNALNDSQTSQLSRPQSPESQQLFEIPENYRARRSHLCFPVPAPDRRAMPTGDYQDTTNQNLDSQNAASSKPPSSSRDELQRVNGTDNQYQASGRQGAIAVSERGALSEGIMTQVSKELEDVAISAQNVPSTQEGMPPAELREAGTPLKELPLAHHLPDVTRAEPNQSVAAVYLGHAANHPSIPQASNGIVPQQAFSATSAATPILPADLADIPQPTASNNPHHVVLHGATFSGPVTFVIYPTTPQTILPPADSHLTGSGQPQPSQGGGMPCSEYSSIPSQPVSRAASLHKSHPDVASSVSSQSTLHGDQPASLYRHKSQITKNAPAKIVLSNGFRRAIVVFPTLHISRKVGMLLDSGSDVNVMPMSLVEKLGLCDCIDRTATLLCLSLSGHDIETVGSITITWAGTRHSWKYRTVFYVLPESNKAVDEMVLGATSIAKYKLLTIRIFGGRLRKLLPDPIPDEKTKNNRIEHEKYKQDKRAMIAERLQKKEAAEPARQGPRATLTNNAVASADEPSTGAA